jgi:uncharacterized protein (DUF433 family)
MTTQYQNRIVVNPKVMLGKPIIKGTRITVELILRQLAQGLTTKEILKNYPHITREDILAALEYASQLVEEEEIYPLHQEIYGQAQAFAR